MRVTEVRAWPIRVPGPDDGLMASTGIAERPDQRRASGYRVVPPYRCLFSDSLETTIVRLTTDVGIVGVGRASVANAINARGQVVGGSGGHAFLWTPSGLNGATGAMIDLGTLGTSPDSAPSQAKAINARGQVVGWSFTPTGERHAFLWTPDAPGGTSGTMVDLGTPAGVPGDASTEATGINAAGQVVGFSVFSAADLSGRSLAFLWTPNQPNGTVGTFTDLGSFGMNVTGATSINDAGQVVGLSRDFRTRFASFLWTSATGMILLPELGGFGGDGSCLINATGQVVGTSLVFHASGRFLVGHAFVWTPDAPNGTQGQILDLTPAATDFSEATAVNDAGQVVGFGGPVDVGGHPFLWQGGVMTDLSPQFANPGSTRPTGINAAGQIVGQTRISVGDQLVDRAFLLTPAPTAPPDTTPPATLAKADPGPNANGWNNADVTVGLSAADDAGGSGAKSITFSANGAQTIASTTVLGSSASATISAEGTTTLSFFATDNAGNQETPKTLTVRIDKTPPEAVVQFDQAGSLTVVGTDALSGVPTAPTLSTALAGGLQTRAYTVADAAGNTLVLVAQVKQEPGEAKATLASLRYNGGPVLTPAVNQAKFEAQTNPDGSRTIEQVIVVGTDQVKAEFRSATNQTAIRRGKTTVVRPGLVLLRLVTANGQLVIQF